MKNTLWLLAILLLPVPSVRAQSSSPIPAPTATDARVVATSQFYLDRCTRRAGGPLEVALAVERVVGAVEADGTLRDAPTLINNGVVSRFATLRLVARHDKLSGRRVPLLNHLTFNEQEFGPNGAAVFMTGASGTWQVYEYKIPIELIHFGENNNLVAPDPNALPAPPPRATPAPTENYVFIFPDLASPEDEENWCTTVDWVSLSFDALYPVVMIHGNGSCGKFFEGDVDCKRDANGNLIGPEILDVTRHFIHPFKQQKILFDNSINLPTDLIDKNGDRLANGDATRGIRSIAEVLAPFGAKHAHLVAHSKGGLDTRAFLKLINPSDASIGVLSLTTLSTPHHGSVGADYVVETANINRLLFPVSLIFSDDRINALFARYFQSPDEGRRNLTTSFVENAFNPKNLPLPQSFTVDDERRGVAYFSFGADANLDNSAECGNIANCPRKPTIQGNEIERTPLAGKSYGAYVTQRVYRLLGNKASAKLKGRFLLRRLDTVETDTFQLNDFLVTENSSKLTGFTAQPLLDANHATMVDASVASKVIEVIRSTQLIR